MTVSLGAVHRCPLRSLEVLYPTACAEDWEEKGLVTRMKKSRCRRQGRAQLTPRSVFIAIADGGHHLHRALAIHRRVDLLYPGPAITSHQGPATGGRYTLCEACHVVP